MLIASIIASSGSALHILLSFTSNLKTFIEVDNLGPMRILANAALALFEEWFLRKKVSIFSSIVVMSAQKE